MPAVYDQNVGKRQKERESEESETGHKDAVEVGARARVLDRTEDVGRRWQSGTVDPSDLHIVETSGICSIAATMHAQCALLPRGSRLWSASVWMNSCEFN